MTIYRKLANAARIAALGSVVSLGLAASSQAFTIIPVPEGFEAIQTLTVSSTKGGSLLHQYRKDGTVRPARTRVCLMNMSATPKAFTHAVPGVKTLRAAPLGGRACATFSSSDRVAFGLVDDGEPAQASKAMVMSLSAFKGGTVGFVWQ